jgi:photosystem II stability/assembly factor-like uncharacterized protein
LIVGGDYQKPEATDKTAARTTDGGRSWELLKTQGPAAFRSSVAFAPAKLWHTALAVGASGTDLSRDGGLTWMRLDKENLNAVALDNGGVAWAVGPKGRVAKMTVVQVDH